MARNTASLLTSVAAAGLIGLPGSAIADHSYKPRAASADNYWVDARVIAVEPLVRLVSVTTPREVCWEERVTHAGHYERPSATPKIFGAIIGGAVGNQFGSGRGNDLMTAAGALLGASMGADAARAKQGYRPGYVTTEQRCEIEQVRHQEERTEGYRVTYRFAGRDFETYSPVDPGNTIRVRVNLEPVAYNR